ncbi:hypothetical protein [Streptomyces spororaveus]|uniref:hypothetical protein n=1 Tax=Streptomyces spororaveus TaxID=284039 RepID=UPI00207A1AC1|nr:hypothetical protein [Streptomyces spororaveus]MCM9077929.1 hypothetical protein [Streptomyces spororaveus]
MLATLTVALPAHTASAESGGTPDAGPDCRPSVRILESLPGEDPYPNPWLHRTQVNDIGPAGLSVGVSHDLPAYWIGTKVFAVPLPAGATGGRVAAVNRSGLMVGTLTTATWTETLAFSYRPGARGVTLLPGGHTAADVNDRGHIVGTRYDDDPGVTTGLEWAGGRIHRKLLVPPGYRLDYVTGINNAGQVIGSGFGPSATGDDGPASPGLLWSAAVDAGPTALSPLGSLDHQYRPQDIDDSGRIAGTYLSVQEQWLNLPAVWAAPYGSVRYAPRLPAAHRGTFEGLSPNTNVSVGIASHFLYAWPPPQDHPQERAQYWTGEGPMRALPALAPNAFTTAYTVTDDDRVGGAAEDAQGDTHPVIWTCARKQAFVPADRPAVRTDGADTAD